LDFFIAKPYMRQTPYRAIFAMQTVGAHSVRPRFMPINWDLSGCICQNGRPDAAPTVTPYLIQNDSPMIIGAASGRPFSAIVPDKLWFYEQKKKYLDTDFTD